MTVQALFNFYVQSPHGTWIMELPNAVQLYEFVKTHPIKKVLDLGLGVGLSASVVALAFQDKGEKGHIDSVEQFDKCIKLAKEMIPKELQENLTIHKSEVEWKKFESIPYQYFSCYKTIPDGDYDLIINDGPAMDKEKVGDKEFFIDLPNGTITQMLLDGKIKPGTSIVFDGRIQALKILERFYGDNFYISQIAPKGNDFNVIERKDNEVSYGDITLERMESLGYFKDETKTSQTT